jgi:hypothetical protein
MQKKPHKESHPENIIFDSSHYLRGIKTLPARRDSTHTLRKQSL